MVRVKKTQNQNIEMEPVPVPEVSAPIPVKAKRPAGVFASYVKQNFGSVEGSAPQRMKALSERWKAEKAQKQ